MKLEFECKKEFEPKGMTALSAGLDVKSTVDSVVNPNEFVAVPLGVKIKSIPEDKYLELHIRSSLRFVKHLTQLGTGIIDADFKNEIFMLIKNEGQEPFEIKRGMRVGQLIVKENLTKSVASEYYDATTRTGGFGSTGR